MIQSLHIVRNAVSFDSRVLKETGAILDRFPDKKLDIAAFQKKKLCRTRASRNTLVMAVIHKLD